MNIKKLKNLFAFSLLHIGILATTFEEKPCFTLFTDENCRDVEIDCMYSVENNRAAYAANGIQSWCISSGPEPMQQCELTYSFGVCRNKQNTGPDYIPFTSDLSELLLRQIAEDGPKLPTSPLKYPLFWNIAWVLGNVVLPLILAISTITAVITFYCLAQVHEHEIHEIEVVESVPVESVQNPI